MPKLSSARKAGIALRTLKNIIVGRPVTVSFEVTYNCNARCKHCDLGDYIKEEKKSATLLPGINSDRKVLDLLLDISQRIPQTLDVDVESMIVDLDTVRISGQTDTYETVDSIKNGLEPSDYFTSVTISSAKKDRTGDRIRFEMKLQKAK